MASSISLVNKKVYLIACYDKRDAIKKLQNVYLRMKIDFEDRIVFSQNEMAIIGDKIVLLFKTQREIKHLSNIVFFGLGKTSIFAQYANKSEQLCYMKYMVRSKVRYQRNDRDGILAMYFREGII